MSATGRNVPGHERQESDDYATPAYCVRRLLEKLGLPGGTWLEPCAGSGGIIAEVNRLRSDVKWHAVEILPKYEMDLLGTGATLTIGDFLKTRFDRRFDVVISNPPYSLAQEVIEASMALATHVVMLLRLNFLASEERALFMRNYTPDVYVLPNRPSFVYGRTDACEYGWLVFSGPRDAGGLRILDSTSKEERLLLQADASFWDSVEKSTGCWMWKSQVDRAGYGRFYLPQRSPGPVSPKHYCLAHRVSWFLTYGDPGKLMVCHTCDVPGCVNPEHLFLGTNADNVADKVRKGRQPCGKSHGDGVRGEKHGLAVLTSAAVLEIRKLVAGGMSQADVARKFSVSPQSVCDILHGRRWQHVISEANPRDGATESVVRRGML